MKKKVFILTLSFPICILFLVVTKTILSLGLYGLGEWFIERIFILVIPLSISMILFFLEKKQKFRSIYKLLMYEILLCGISIVVFVNIANIYEVKQKSAIGNSPIERFNSISERIKFKSDINTIDFKYIIIAFYLKFDGNDVLEEKIWNFIDKYLQYPNKFRNEPLIVLLKTFDELENSNYELIKIGPKLFKLQTKNSVLQKNN